MASFLTLLARRIPPLVLMGSLIAGNALAQGVTPVNTIPTLNSFGTLAVTNSSASISAVTVSGGGPIYPNGRLPSGIVKITNSINSGGVVYVCPKGGTCTAAVGSATTGIALAVGEWRAFNLEGQTTAPTVIADSTATIFVEW